MSFDPEVSAYNVAISSRAKSGRWAQALGLLAELRKKQLRPTTVSFNATISACSSGRRWAWALQTLEEMRGVVRPNVISYGACISACERGRQWALSLVLLREMREQGLPLDAVTCSAAISGCGKGGQWALALLLFSELSATGLRWNPYACSAVMSACSSSSRWARSLDIFADARAKGLEADAAIFGAAVTACAQGGHWALALAVLHQMRLRGPSPNTAVFSASITACDRGQQWTLALSVLQLLLRDRLRPDPPAFNAAISACSGVGAWISALRLLEAMGRHALVPEVGRFWQTALAMLPDMRRRGLLPDSVSFNACIHACERGQEWHQALLVLQAMRRSGLAPGLLALNSAASACGKARHWEVALHLLREAKDADLSPSVVTYNAALNACLHGLRWTESLLLLRERRGKELGEEPPTSTSAGLSRPPVPSTWLLGCHDALGACERAGQAVSSKVALGLMRKVVLGRLLDGSSTSACEHVPLGLDLEHPTVGPTGGELGEQPLRCLVSGLGGYEPAADGGLEQRLLLRREQRPALESLGSSAQFGHRRVGSQVTPFSFIGGLDCLGRQQTRQALLSLALSGGRRFRCSRDMQRYEYTEVIPKGEGKGQWKGKKGKKGKAAPQMWINCDALGISLSVLTWALLAFTDWVIIRHVLVAWFWTARPRLSAVPLTDAGSALLILYQLVLGLSWISHVRAMTTDPGTVSESSSPPSYPSPRACKLCQARWKPPRAHHCKTCRRCIFRMDHHCPWINNCVGLGNQKLFILFLGYTALSAALTLLLLAGSAACWLWSQKSLSDAAPPGSMSLICCGVVAVECLAAVLFVGDFLQ
ncbi:unnamed protein product, partial [Polarella glacialis]